MAAATVPKPTFQLSTTAPRGPVPTAPAPRSASIPARTAAPVPSAALETALRVAWIAVHHHAEWIRANFNAMPPREAIDAMGDSSAAFDAVSTLAHVLGVELRVADELCRHAPLWTRRGIKVG